MIGGGTVSILFAVEIVYFFKYTPLFIYIVQNYKISFGYLSKH